MSHERKDEAARRESIRLTGRLKWLLWLPIAGMILAAVWAKGLFRTPKTAAELRATDKARQSGIRRKLRGLPAVHDERAKPVA